MDFEMVESVDVSRCQFEGFIVKTSTKPMAFHITTRAERFVNRRISQLPYAGNAALAATAIFPTVAASTKVTVPDNIMMPAYHQIAG